MKFRVPILSLVVFLLSTWAAWAGDDLKVFAAASMKDAIEHAGQAYRQETGTTVTVVPASSSVLAKQIAEGAPADLYISANTSWMDWVAERGAIREDSRIDIASNALVIAVSKGGEADAATLLGRGRFAMGDPTHVPAGIYAKQALEHGGLWDRVKANAVFGENVRVALALVERGEVGAAIVYRSDLAVAPDLKAAFTFNQTDHDPILYPAAVTRQGGDTAAAFLAFLAGPKGQAILDAAGFAPPPAER